MARSLIGATHLLAIALCAGLTACTSKPVSLAASAPAVAAQPKVLGLIAYLHTPAFRGDTRVIEPYQNHYFIPLRTGEASDRVLRAVYAQVFTVPVEVTSASALRATAGNPIPVALIEPTIERLDYVNAATMGPFFSRIVYRFTLADVNGALLANWRVRGVGEYDPRGEHGPTLSNETAMLTEAPRRAISDGAADFIRAFARVPELMRLTRNMPLAGTNAPAEDQTTRDTGPAEPGLEAAYGDTFVLQVKRVVLPRPPSEVGNDLAQETYLMPLRLTLHNRGAHRLAVYPEDVEWLPDGALAAGNGPLSPLPPPSVSAFLAGRPLGLTVGYTAPGYGMLPMLFASIFNVAEAAGKKRALADWTAVVDRAVLVGGEIAVGTSRDGIVFFPRPQNVDGGTLTVPVIDVDDAVRYTVRVPLPSQ